MSTQQQAAHKRGSNSQMWICFKI